MQVRHLVPTARRQGAWRPRRRAIRGAGRMASGGRARQALGGALAWRETTSAMSELPAWAVVLGLGLVGAVPVLVELGWGLPRLRGPPIRARPAAGVVQRPEPARAAGKEGLQEVLTSTSCGLSPVAETETCSMVSAEQT